MAGLGESEFGGLGGGSESGLAASLGRISGKLLKDNLTRNGAPLSFQNTLEDTPLLYLDTENMRVGINTDSPAYDLDINSNIVSKIVEASDRITVDNIIIDADGFFSTVSGPLYIEPSGHDSTTPSISLERMRSEHLYFNDNTIGSFNNQDIVLDPNSTGTIEFHAITEIEGNLAVTGNINVDGDLSSAGTIYLGDSPLDVVVIGADISQGFIPGVDNAYDLGADRNDSSPRRWAEVHSPDLTNINNIIPQSAVVSEQARIDGVFNRIWATQSNEDISINPATGISYIESLKFEGNDITNLVGVPRLDPSAVAAGILEAAAGNTAFEYNVWNESATGLEIIVTGPGSSVEINRTSKLGDIRNDPDNPGGLDALDSQLILEVGNEISGTGNQQIWYHTVIKPRIFEDSYLYSIYGNGNAVSNLPITFANAGTGYVSFAGNDNAMVIPSGTSAQRQYLEEGETRWNTELNYLECFDGEKYIISTGAGEVVSVDLMSELALTRAVVFG